MKTISAMMISAVVPFTLLIASVSCTSTSPKTPPESQIKHKDMHEHHHNHEHHGHESTMHMKHMKKVEAGLRNELGSLYDQPVPVATEAQLSDGKKIYMGSCAPCHGVSGQGDGPAASTLTQKPADFTNSEHAATYSDQGRIHIIKKGIQGTPMEGWETEFTEKEVLSVYVYIRSLKPKKSIETHSH